MQSRYIKKMKDRICEFECNIDDMTAEELAFAAERLMEEGAKDVTLTSCPDEEGPPGDPADCNVC